MDECIWTEDPEYGTWETSCGETFCMIEGTPEENGYKYCPSCGKKLRQAHYQPEQDEADE